MKKRAYGLLAITIIGSLLTMSSCKKYLDNNLSNGTYDNVFWNSQQDAEAAVNGAYALYRRADQNRGAFFIWGDCPVGMIFPDNSYLKPVYESGNFVVPYYEGMCHDWTNWFRIVNQCNMIIDKVAKIPENKFKSSSGTALSARNNLVGEAYFMRALAYFTMVRVWGDVPVQNEPIYAAEQIKLKARSPQDSVLGLIMGDAQQASNLMTWDVSDKYLRARAGKGAAIALLAHVTAWQHKYDRTVTYVDSLLNSGYYTLESPANLPDLYRANKFSKENIFLITNSNAYNEGSYNADDNHSLGYLTLMEPYLIGRTEVPLFTVLPEALSKYYTESDKDARYNAFFGLTNTAKPLILKYSDVIYKNTAENTDPVIQSNVVIYRLADLLLLKAEALANLGQEQAAMQTANIVRARAGISNMEGMTSDVLKRALLDERIRELVGEGHNYFDMIRTGYYPNWMTASGGDRMAKKGWLWPVAKKVFDNNPLMVQNEYWKGRY
ncbi:MAG TPA: RagB/SusD family nutrient uptake outer membrane protein [Chitinophaga sp.]|uniref:RagB/SusD family nutrient uptake outer membrane protein n=1 Tax=Chitinophaga sp. TaxID=1869181 RepID=UPI002B588162|nr:RagB/SusD family nutrient uptake outer membrane protein [Chitinophaga sp.]HVI43969.1 RagB/SusD family nutrient uptake outer membrane protein [Chitinophaga sp.]